MYNCLHNECAKIYISFIFPVNFNGDVHIFSYGSKIIYEHVHNKK